MDIQFKLDSRSVRETLFLTFEVDETTFTEELAEELALQWSRSYWRALYNKCGSYKKAVLNAYALRCFYVLISKDGWTSKAGITQEFKNGIDGFYDFETMGLTLKSISDYELDLDIDEISEVP